MNEVSFLVTLSLSRDEEPTEEEVSLLRENIDRAVERAVDNGLITPDESNLGFWHYQVNHVVERTTLNRVFEVPDRR